jgi:SAM-dependent methyltransferase
MNSKKNKSDLNKEYWEEKYKINDTGWDLGYISTPIKEFIDQLSNRQLKILIPGGGNSFEAEYLLKQGYNCTVLDIAKQPLRNVLSRFPSFPGDNLIQQDFFDHNGSYDLILEQTFFCALHPDLRNKYVKKMNQLLNKNGKLVGLLFDFELTEEGPPFGGSLKEYQNIFSAYFNIKVLERCYNSIKPRFGRELFFIFEKK